MLRGLYTAVSAMQTTEKKLDVTSNNMANINTTGFKKDTVVSQSFPEVLLHKINGQLPTEPFNRNLQVEVERDGEGFRLFTESGYFRAEGITGNSYSSSTTFAIDEEGYLKTYMRDHRGNLDTSEGNYILDNNGNRIQVEGNDIEINPQGQVISNGQTVANLVARPGFNTIGTINSGVMVNKVQTYFTEGGLEPTSNPLDLAIKGEGFFRISTPMGEMYTRNGNFTLNANGEMVTTEGHYLMGPNGSVWLGQQDFDLQEIAIGEDGAIVVNGEVIDQIDIINITNMKDLRKYGEGYYQMAGNIEPQTEGFKGEVLQGYLETSNVNAIQEMVQMISSLRNYESNQKVVQAYDEMLQRAVNDIGKV
ncbi:MAG: flagellar hook-basal body protein [Clostridiaceae bacterium]|nr:flagellar hook-basal body protein [Clostridiaceae bacterium]